MTSSETSPATSDDLLSMLESVAVRYRTQYMADLARINLTPSEAAILLLLGEWADVPWPDQKTIRDKLPGSAPPSRTIRELHQKAGRTDAVAVTPKRSGLRTLVASGRVELLPGDFRRQDKVCRGAILTCSGLCQVGSDQRGQRH